MTSLLAAVALTLTLGACTAGSSPDPSPEPSSPPVASPSPESEPSGSLPALTELVVTPEGLGPIMIGAEPEGDDFSDPLIFNDACTGFPEGLWVANYPLEVPGNSLPPFAVQVGDGVITSIEVHSAGPATPEGIHVGSSREELIAAYPAGFDDVIEDAVSTLYVVRGTTSNVMFEVGNVSELQFDPSRVDVVWSIRVWTDAFTPSTIAGSEYTAPWCGLP